jgi:hypothetical protein
VSDPITRKRHYAKIPRRRVGQAFAAARLEGIRLGVEAAVKAAEFESRLQDTPEGWRGAMCAGWRIEELKEAGHAL